MRKRLATVFLLICPGVFLLICTGVCAVPAVWNAVRWTIAGDDPVALTDVGIGSELTEQRLEVELNDAISKEDTDLAASFFELANQQGLRVPKALLDRHAELTSVFAQGKRCLYNGCGIGEINSAEKFSCFLVCDFTPYGNFRDLMGEARKYWNGEEADEVVVGLAFVGLASNIGLLATQGGAAAALAPELAGVSLIKGLARAGRLPTAIATRIRKSLKEGINFQALYDSLKKIHWYSLVSDVDDFKNTSVFNQERIRDFLSIMQQISALARSDAGYAAQLKRFHFRMITTPLSES